MFSNNRVMSKILLLGSCLFSLSACLSSPEKSSTKINAITNTQTTETAIKPTVGLHSQIQEKDRCVGIKPTDEHYKLCEAREPYGQKKVKNQSVVFKWKKK